MSERITALGNITVFVPTVLFILSVMFGTLYIYIYYIYIYIYIYMEYAGFPGGYTL